MKTKLDVCIDILGSLMKGKNLSREPATSSSLSLPFDNIVGFEEHEETLREDKAAKNTLVMTFDSNPICLKLYKYIFIAKIFMGYNTVSGRNFVVYRRLQR